MTLQGLRRVLAAAFVAVAALLFCMQDAGAAGAQPAGAEAAVRMTGTWKLNRELSPAFAAPGPRGVTPGRGGARFSTLGFDAGQRGGRGRGTGSAEPGGDLSPLMPAEAAAQAALSIVQQVPLELTIDATAEEVTFLEPRGKSRFRIDNKTTPVEVPGGSITVKSRWDRQTLRQEFSSAQRRLRRTWSVNGDGRLVLKQRIESLTLVSKEVEAVFDRQ
jgi:hypothetical protein